MPIGEFCNREVVVTSPETPIPDVARLMRRYHVGDVVIAEEREGERIPVGILTDRDIVVALVAEDVDVDKFSAGEVMSFDLTTTREEEDLSEALRIMRERGVRRLPVVNGRGGLVGILTMDDVLELLAEQASHLVTLVSNEEKREKRCRN